MVALMGGGEKTERNAEIVRLWSMGVKQAELGEIYGISKQAVSAIIQRWRVSYPRTERAEEIDRMVDLLDELTVMAVEVAEQTPAPVTAGKDGMVVYDPEVKGPDGRPAVVRDHSARLAAIATARAVLERKSKLLGLDSATKVEATQHITYDIPGIDPSTLQ